MKSSLEVTEEHTNTRMFFFQSVLEPCVAFQIQAISPHSCCTYTDCLLILMDLLDSHTHRKLGEGGNGPPANILVVGENVVSPPPNILPY